MRSLTVGLPIWTVSTTKLSEDLKFFISCSKKLFLKHKVEPRTIRLTLPPVPLELMYQSGAIRSVLSSVQKLAADSGARWYCLPIDLTHDVDYQDFLTEILNILVKDQRLFINLIVGNEKRISISGANLAAEFILNLSRRSQNGFDNFRVGVSCACVANTPFFPFSRHEGEVLAFSLALETTLSAIQSIKPLVSKDAPLELIRDALQSSIESKVLEANDFGLALEKFSNYLYKGLDASYAPFPDGETSVGALIECFGVSPVGSNGTLFITSILTDTLKKVLKDTGVRCAGFNGVMYSVLEDPKLASSNNLTNLSLEKLALFSTLCGCGIDMAPIPGTTYVEDVAAIILDVAAMSVRLSKPLGVRLVPIPNKLINEYASFNLDFLCDSRVMNIGISDSNLTLSKTKSWEYLN